MRRKPEVLRSQTLAETRLFRIEQRDLRFGNGVHVQYERLLGAPHGAVLVVPVREDDTVVLVREYAAGVHRYELGLPKGRMEAQESIPEAANREIMEEIGHGARHLEHLSTMTLAPGYLGHATHIVLARDLYERAEAGDEPEALEITPWHLGALDELLATGECTEARSIAALYMVRDRLSRHR